ncbi:MAG: hypothetical protein ACRD1R_08890 [Acidobacteriota bacterium]
MKIRTGVISLLISFLCFAAMPAEVAPSAKDIRPLRPGSQIPEISFEDLEGRTISLSALVAEKPAILIFYRGGW